MKREMLSKVFDGIEEDYRLEALESNCVAEVSELKTMKNTKRKIITLVAAVSTIAAIGTVAIAAGQFNIFENAHDTNEPVEVVDDVYVGDGQYETFSFTYENVSKYFTFTGIDTCNEIEFKADIPEPYESLFPHNEWDTGLSASYETDELYDSEYNLYVEECLDVQIFYTSQFGEDGMLFMQNNVIDGEAYEEGDFRYYKFTDADESEYYTFMFNTSAGYLIVVSGTVQEDVDYVVDNIEVRETGNTITYDPDATHDYYLCTALG